MGNNDINSSIGQRLHKLRTDRNLTLESLASVTGVSVSMLSAIERGVKSPTLTVLNKINTGLQISLAELFDESYDDDCRIIHRDDMRHLFFNKSDEIVMMFESKQCKSFDVKLHRLGPHSRWDSEPHSADLWEHCMVTAGDLTMRVRDNEYRVATGEVFSFRTDAAHSYLNEGDDPLEMIIIGVYH